jgi:protein-serine/threonine kinase
MEYVAGGDMYSKIAKGHFYDSLEIACFFKQILNGLNYIHSLGIAHR